MATSRRGTNFKEFAATLRYPPIQVENESSDPLATPRAQFLKDFAVNVLNDVLKDLKEEGLEQYANEYNKHPFKNYLEKVREDESLKNPVNKAAKAALVNESNLQSGDPFAEAIYDIIDSFTDNVTLDKDGVFGKTENSARAREELLAAMGVNSVKLLGFIALSSLARSIPIEQVTQYNVQQYLQFLDPVFLLEKLISGIKNQSISSSINDFKLVGRFINGVLTSSQFESKVQKAFLDYIAEQPDVPPSLRNIASFDEIIFITNPDNINENSDEDTFRAVSTITFDLLQNGKLGIDIKLVSKDLQGNVLGEISLNNLSDQMTGFVTGAQEDLQSIFDLLESCELPDADMFNKYRKTGVAVGQFFKGFKPIRLGKTKKGKIKIPDRHEIVEAALVSALVSSFYVATATLFKLTLQYLQKLVPDLSCAQISGMLVPEETLGPRTQNATVDPLQAAKIIANNLKDNPANLRGGIKIDDVAAILAEIANSIGLFSGVDIASLNEFVSLTISILTQREFCELISGSPTGDVITLVQNVIDIKFPNAGISKIPEDIIRFFSSISTMVDPGCETILDTIDLPVNTILCATPEYYRLYNDLRIALLRERGLTDQDIEVQINKVCELNNRQIQQFLDLLNNDDPLNSMIPLIQTGDPNCGPETSLGPAMDVIKPELVRSYKAIFDPLRESLDNNMVGPKGFLSTILSAKNGLPFPLYLKIAKLTSESYDQAQLMAAQSQLAMSARIDSLLEENTLQNEIQQLVELDYDPSLLIIEPKKVASWLRLNQEEFCNLNSSDRMKITPLSVIPVSFRNPLGNSILSDEDKERLRYIADLTESQVMALTFTDDILNYNDFYGKFGLGNPLAAVRTISYSGMSDPRQNSIGSLSFDGIRQLNLKSGALQTKIVINPRWAFVRAFSLVHPLALIQTIASKIFAGSDPYLNNIDKQIEVQQNSNPLQIPGINKNISADSPSYRIKSYNFFIFPFENDGKGTGTITTKIFEYLPANLESLNDRGVVANDSNGVLTVTGSYQYVENSRLSLNPQLEFSNTRKSYELLEINKKPEDYHIPITDQTLRTDIVDSLPNQRASGDGSKRSKVFANFILESIRDNVGISLEEIPQLNEYSEYLQKELYNYVYNSYLDNIIKIPSYNGRNLSFGVTDQRVNTLNSLHVNTVTGAPDPVTPEDFDGSEIDPSIYFYNKLSDDWKNLYNAYIRERNTDVSPPRTPVPDFEGFAERASELYLKIQEEVRESTDYSNQFPFDLIVSKSALVTMDSLVDMMIKVFCFEHYYKAFPVLNPLEISDSVMDNVYFDFLAKRFKSYAGRAAPNASRRRQKSNKFYYMLMEMYVSLLIKKRDAKIINSITQTTQDAINQISRKSNIWRLGVPSTNLTNKEATYLNAVSALMRYEVPGYPLGTISSGIAASQGAIGPVNRIYEDAKKKRSEQVRLRNDFWNRIMEDCEPIFESLLQERFRSEMSEISRQLSILNPDLIRENSILNMPINGGPIMQNDEKIPSPDGTAYMRNVYTHHPLSMYSAGNSLISEKGYRAYYGTEENNNDRNMNGFLFTSLYNKQPHPNSTVLLNNNPKEPVYKYSVVSDGEEFESDIRGAFQDFDPRNSTSGKEKMDFVKYSPDFLTPSLYNFIELQKRNITVNKFLLDSLHTKVDLRSNRIKEIIAFQDEAIKLQNIDANITQAANGLKISDVLLATENDQSTSFWDAEVLDLQESLYGSLKRYKVISTDGSEFRKVGVDSYAIGSVSASNMPLIFSQVPIPLVNEQYINLERLDTPTNPNLAGIDLTAYVDPVTGENLIENTRYNLERILYDDPNVFEPRTFSSTTGDKFNPLCSGVFSGPSSLTALIYWLGSSGFLYNTTVGSKQTYTDFSSSGQEIDFLDFPIKWFFKPGTFKYGVRTLLIQPNSNLTMSEELYNYFENTMLPKPTPSDATTNVRERIKNQKVLLRENGYGIPLFKEEKVVEWTFRDLKNIYDSYLSGLTEDVPSTLSVDRTSTKWIDHTGLTRFLTIELFGNVVCSEKYKTMFDYVIPLRYFMSLSAIYCTKGFVDSIGSSVDWNGVKSVNPRAFSRRETEILLPFYQAVRKVFYYSYNSFDPFYLGEGDDNEDIITEEAYKELNNRPSIITDRGESIERLSEIQSDILKANQVDPLFRENLGDLRDIIGYGYKNKVIPDPTNGDGNVSGS